MVFPLTDMTGTRRRPGLVLYDAGDEDVMLARITTQEPRHRTDLRLSDWKATGLIAESVVRLSKIATIKKSLVDRRLGAVSARDRAIIRSVWARMFPTPR